MRRLLVFLGCLAASHALASDSPLGDAAPPPAGSPFHAELLAAPDSLAPGETALMRVVLRIPAGHYVYEERTSFEILPGAGHELIEVRSPTAKTKHDTFLDEDVQVHDHDAEFTAQLHFHAETTVRAVLSTQGCS